MLILRVIRDTLAKCNISENSLNYGDKTKEIKIDEKNIQLIKTTFERKQLEKKIIYINLKKMHVNLIRSIALINISTKKRKEKESSSQ